MKITMNDDDINYIKIKIGDVVIKSKSYDYKTNESTFDDNDKWVCENITDYFKDIPDFIVIAKFHKLNNNESIWIQSGANWFISPDYEKNKKIKYEQLKLF